MSTTQFALPAIGGAHPLHPANLPGTCPFCGYELDEFAGLDVLGGYQLDWVPCCYDMRDAVGRHGWATLFGSPLEEHLNWLRAGEVCEVLHTGDGSLLRCRLTAHNPGPGTRGWQTSVFRDIREHHRHHDPPRGWKFGIACYNGQLRVGVVSVGRPVSRVLQKKEPRTLESTRVCTWGPPQLRRNAVTKLYGAAAREARRLGYDRLITYTLITESGISLKAAGFVEETTTEGGSWDRESRPRTDHAPMCRKRRWGRKL